jgi:nicotinamide-nucleotide amidase
MLSRRGLGSEGFCATGHSSAEERNCSGGRSCNETAHGQPRAGKNHLTVHDFDQFGHQRMSDGGRDPETYVYTPVLEERAAAVLSKAHHRKLSIVTAESCTGGALAALLTDVEGLSHVLDRGYVVYTDEAKQECLGVDGALIEEFKPVSEAVAAAMAQGGLRRSLADIAIAITGNAGPAGPDDEEGLVFIAVASRDGQCLPEEHHFGSVGRSRVRMCALNAALDLLEVSIDKR